MSKSEEKSRKVLEEIQKVKSHMLKGGAAASLSTYTPTTGNNHFNTPGGGIGDVHMTPGQRSAMQTLQQTNASSFGSFVYQESHFGNSILPVLPRLENSSAKAKS